MVKQPFFHVKIWNHPIETTILIRGCFRFQVHIEPPTHFSWSEPTSKSHEYSLHVPETILMENSTADSLIV